MLQLLLSVATTLAVSSAMIAAILFRRRLWQIAAAAGIGTARYFGEFRILKTVHRGYWGIQSINFLDNLYGFAFGTVSTIFMSVTLGFSDIGAGAALSWLGIFTSVFLFASGPLVDWLGLKKSLVISIVFVVFVRSGMALCAFWTLLPFGPAVQAWFYDLAGYGSEGFAVWFRAYHWRPTLYIACLALGGLPVAVKNTAYHIGNKQFTTKESQSAGFNLWYIIMNVSALAAGFTVDLFRGWHLHYGWFIILGVATASLSLLATLLFIREVPGQEDTKAKKIRAPRAPDWVWYAAFARCVVGKATQALAYARSVMKEPSFWRMMAAVTLNLGVSAVFIYWSMISPKYWDRAIGPDAAIGKLSAINPAIIIVGLILLVPVIGRFKTFTMLTWGSFISAASLLPLTIPWHWVSADPKTAYYATNIASMVLFSFGEMMFSPRLSQYILAVAPRGQEGIYSSFAALPSFVRSTVVGFLSGVMLTRWCPETRVIDGVARPLREVIASRTLPYWETPEMMWLILTVAALVGPLLMILLRRWFTRGLEDKI